MEYFFSDLDVSSIGDSIIFLDIDGTIVPDGSREPSAAAIKKIGDLMARNRVYLCTNKKNHERNRAVATLTGAHYLQTPWRKPSKNILQHLTSLSSHAYVVIGDKFSIDGWFAWRIGAKFIKVQRIIASDEPLVIRLSYWVDNLLAKLFS